MFVHLLDGDGQSVAGANAYPLEPIYRTYEWQPGETIISSAKLDIPREFKRDFDVLMVGTQSSNIPSMRMYEKCGFRISETADMAHLHWRAERAE